MECTQVRNLGVHVKSIPYGTYDDLHSPTIFSLSHLIVYVPLIVLFNCLSMNLDVDLGRNSGPFYLVSGFENRRLELHPAFPVIEPHSNGWLRV